MGNYLVKEVSVEHWGDAGNIVKIVLDTDSNENFDSAWVLPGMYDLVHSNAANVKIYSDVVTLDEELGLPFEMMSTLHDSSSTYHGVYRFWLSGSYINIQIRNSVIITSGNHYLGSAFENINAQTLAGLVNDTQDEYHVGLARFTFNISK